MSSKLKHPATLLICATGGMVYFNTIASLEAFPIVKSYFILAPIAAGITIRMLWLKQKSRSDSPS